MPRKPKVSTINKQTIDNELSTIAKILKARRIELGWTQNDLAEKLECEVTTVQAYEQKRRNPSLPTLLSICKILKLKLTIN
ncbi:MAG: helix-turn-helix transcriptional regulator [Bdellovibrionaceae bacterium]|nr:helix-turn-helix transcriptional regulator [Pseudobdellovibrionaceae bacterium]MBX3034180.1 helix-turn-helix transcriptional regulator [Pseudobdellovibrionaceae bacterium]